MLHQKSKKIFIYLFLFLIIGTLNNKNINNFYFFKIDAISIKGLDEKNNNQLSKDLNFLKFNNLFFLDKLKINSISLIKLIPRNAAISGTKESFVIPG